jgi:hypothetical protein
LFASLLIAASVAAPQPAAAEDKAAADAAFREGKRLLAAGETAQACARFEGSLKLMEQLGVRLNLADCYERMGKMSAAYAAFRAAEIAAKRAGDSRANFARARIAALAERMPTLTVVVSAGADVAGLEIRRDGEPLDGGLLDMPLPVDPGEHTVEAVAPGHRAWSTTIVTEEGSRHRIEVPLLRREPDKKARPAGAGTGARRAGSSGSPGEDASVSAGRPGRTRRLVAIGVGVAGAAAVATGLVFGAQARSTWDDARADGHCTDDGVCDDIGYPLAGDARRSGTVATVLVGAGLAAATAGVIVYVTAPADERRSGRPARASLSPVVTAHGAGLAVIGRF